MEAEKSSLETSWHLYEMPDDGELMNTVARLEARFQTFSAVEQCSTGESDLDAAIAFSKEHARNIILPSHYAFAQRIASENGVALDEDAYYEDEAEKRVAKDRRIAEHFSEGVKIKGKTWYVRDLIMNERLELLALLSR